MTRWSSCATSSSNRIASTTWRRSSAGPTWVTCPRGRVVGISKLARVVDVFARRFQVQEKMTAEIARCINDVLQPQGVGVVIEAAHECMTTRGIHKRGVSMITSKMLGSFRSDARTRNEFLTFIDIRDRR